MFLVYPCYIFSGTQCSLSLIHLICKPIKDFDNKILVLNAFESQTAKEINTRKALAEAYKGKDLYELKEAVENFEKQGLHEVDGAFGKASQKMGYLEMVKGSWSVLLPYICPVFC